MNIPFKFWWITEGSKLSPKADEESEEFFERICRIAWDNGEETAKSYIKRTLIDKLDKDIDPG